MKAEELRDFEAGYRAQAGKRVSLDVTAFVGLYRNLESSAAETPYFASTQQGVPYLVLPELFVNGPPAHTYGAEFFANWNVTDHWRISPGYSYFHIDVDGDSSGSGYTAGHIAESSISGQIAARPSAPSGMGQHARIRQQAGGWKYSGDMRGWTAAWAGEWGSSSSSAWWDRIC